MSKSVSRRTSFRSSRASGAAAAAAPIVMRPAAWLHVLVVAALLLSLLSALSVRTTFAEAGPKLTMEGYTAGTIHNQDGWSSSGSAGAGGPGYDHAVATQSTYPTFGKKTLRMSNAVVSGSFGDQTFTKSLANEAGETAAVSDGKSGGTRQPFFSADFDFASADPANHQPGLHLSVSPDRGDGARMSWVQIVDEEYGLTVNFGDYQSSGGGFVYTAVATGLDRSIPHHIRLTMQFVDGADNDIVQVFVDGDLVHTGTSWEGYFTGVEGNPTRPVDSLLFRTGGDGAPATAGKGFYFDNIRLASGAVPSTTENYITVTPGDLGPDAGDWHQANERTGGRSVIAPLADKRGGDGAVRQWLPNPASPSPKTDMQVFSSDTTFAEGEGFKAATGFGLVSDLTAASFDYYRDSSSTAGAHLSPSMRLWVYDPDRGTHGSSYIAVWEKAYNGAGNIPTDTWLNEEISADNLWVIPQYIDGAWKGIGYCNSINSANPDNCFVFNRQLSQWNFGPNAVVFGVEVGLGSGWNGNYLGRFDNVSLTAGGPTTTWDFETAAGSTLDVYASGENTWVTESDSTAAISFENGPSTPPLGTGSVQMLTGSDGASNGRLRSTSLAGVALTDLTTLTYATYVTDNDSCQAPFLILEVDTSGDGNMDDLLFFEPCYQTGTYPGDPVPNQGAVALNTWQTWDALSGGWWSLNSNTGGPPLKTLTNYMAANPTAKIVTAGTGGLRIQVGGGGATWANFVGNADAVTIGVAGVPTTYNFDVAPDTSAPAVSNVAVTPPTATAPATVTLTATVDDSTTGGSVITGASYTLNGGTAQPMSATDGTFDTQSEAVTATIANLAAGTYNLCVTGTDAESNSATEACTTLVVDAPPPPDTAGPVVTGVSVSPNPAFAPATVQLSAIVSDSTTGDNRVASASYTVNGGGAKPMTATDRNFNTSTEGVRATINNLPAGTHTICVTGKDSLGNVGEQACTTLVVNVPDTQAPLVLSVTSQFNPVKNNQATRITAVVDDTTTGNSDIAWVQYRINNGSWSSMGPEDGAWDEPQETAFKTLSFSEGNTYQICVRAKDTANRTSGATCMTLTVFEREDGKVTASGQYTAPKKTITSTPNYSGRATFTLNASYRDRQWSPDGSFTLSHSGSAFSFQSTSLSSLVIDGNRGEVLGTGKLNGQSGYSFEVDFQDIGNGTQDKIRVRIWNTSTGKVVYDTQPGKSVTSAPTVKLTSGNIAIQQ